MKKSTEAYSRLAGHQLPHYGNSAHISVGLAASTEWTCPPDNPPP